MKSIKYEVVVQVMASQGGVERKIPVDVPHTPDENGNKAAAIVQATLVLDGEGVDRWSLVRCTPVTS